MEVPLIRRYLLHEHREFRAGIVPYPGPVRELMVDIPSIGKSQDDPTIRRQMLGHEVSQDRLPIEGGAMQGVDRNDEVIAQVFDRVFWPPKTKRRLRIPPLCLWIAETLWSSPMSSIAESVS